MLEVKFGDDPELPIPSIAILRLHFINCDNNHIPSYQDYHSWAYMLSTYSVYFF